MQNDHQVALSILKIAREAHKILDAIEERVYPQVEGEQLALPGLEVVCKGSQDQLRGAKRIGPLRTQPPIPEEELTDPFVDRGNRA